MKLEFLVDAQLPPALAAWLRARGHAAVHVFDLDTANLPDHAIAKRAKKTGAIIVTKDADFARMAGPRPQVLWIRFGNASAKDLVRTLEPVISDIERALRDGQKIVEVSR